MRRAGRLDARRGTAQGECGQATVELALVLPLVVVLLAGVVQLALVARDDNLVAHAAREAVRAAAVDDAPAAPRRAAEAAGPLAADRLDVRTGERGAPGSTVTVVVTYSSPVRLPLIGALVDDVDLEARATMRVER